jgi:hypothetical protein
MTTAKELKEVDMWMRKDIFSFGEHIIYNYSKNIRKGKMNFTDLNNLYHIAQSIAKINFAMMFSRSKNFEGNIEQAFWPKRVADALERVEISTELEEACKPNFEFLLENIDHLKTTEALLLTSEAIYLRNRANNKDIDNLYAMSPFSKEEISPVINWLDGICDPDYVVPNIY